MPSIAAKRRVIWEKAAFSYNPQLDYANAKELDNGHLGKRKCPYCKAMKYQFESEGLCCCGGRVKLPTIESPPEPLRSLMDWKTEDGKHFLKNIRKFNTVFQMTSFGAENTVNMQGYMPTFAVEGQIYHQVGSLLPEEGVDSKFLQIYFVGGEEQITRRRNIIPDLRASVVEDLQNMLYTENHLVRSFKQVVETTEAPDFNVVIRPDKTPTGEHVRRFNAPTTSEMAVLMVNEEGANKNRYIIIRKRDGQLRKIIETNIAHDGLQYPLLFVRGEDGYHFETYQWDNQKEQYT